MGERLLALTLSLFELLEPGSRPGDGAVRQWRAEVGDGDEQVQRAAQLVEPAGVPAHERLALLVGQVGARASAVSGLGLKRVRKAASFFSR